MRRAGFRESPPSHEAGRFPGDSGPHFSLSCQRKVAAGAVEKKAHERTGVPPARKYGGRANRPGGSGGPVDPAPFPGSRRAAFPHLMVRRMDGGQNRICLCSSFRAFRYATRCPGGRCGLSRLVVGANERSARGSGGRCGFPWPLPHPQRPAARLPSGKPARILCLPTSAQAARNARK